jgi:hypothetical protein
MADFNFATDCMMPSTELWRRRLHAEALKLVDTGVAEAEHEKQISWVQILCLHASVIAESMGDLGLVRRYCEKALSCEAGDTSRNALALYCLADAMFRQGETDPARQHAARCYALVAHSSTGEDRGLLKLLTKKWPDIAEWQR